MDAVKLIAVVLIAAGILALVFGGFSFTKESHSARVGPFDFSFREKERVNVPLWAVIEALPACAHARSIPSTSSAETVTLVALPETGLDGARKCSFRRDKAVSLV